MDTPQTGVWQPMPEVRRLENEVYELFGELCSEHDHFRALLIELRITMTRLLREQRQESYRTRD